MSKADGVSVSGAYGNAPLAPLADACAVPASHPTPDGTPRLITLAADLPAAVLADVLGIHEATATRWAHRTKPDRHTYLAQGRADGNDQPSPLRSEHVFE